MVAWEDLTSQCLFVFQEDECEWGSSSILDALPSITSQQRRLALAAMRWRKALQGHSEHGVHADTNTVKHCSLICHLRNIYFCLNKCLRFSGSLQWVDSHVEHWPKQRIRLQAASPVWWSEGYSLFIAMSNLHHLSCTHHCSHQRLSWKSSVNRAP